MKSRKVKAVAKSKAFMSKKQKKGNIPLDDYSESDADVDENELLYNERDHEDDDFKSAEEKSTEEKAEDILDKEDNIKLLKKSSPELFVFIDELKEKLAELKDKVSPLYSAVQDGKISDKKLSSYINNYYLILMHYCMNLSFYMAIRSKGPVMSSHPVIKRINSFKNMLDQLNDMKIIPSKTLEHILNKLKNNEEVTIVKKKPVVEDELPDQNSIRKKFLEISQMKTAKDNLKNNKKPKQIEKVENKLEEPSDSEAEEMDIDENATLDVEAGVSEETTIEGKRKITYQIAKNKGLTAKRKKEARNPRVHNRMKFRKAKIRRKGQVREVIRETKRYDGEPTGISTHVVKSIKFK
ncbi:Something about silencing protein 10 [Araneus ventricosus]|uniref:Something about silencing protein 10 n=1 Tax=Araneus ventricosus TaxID=182803 RepID=A0A4Y2GMR4_ARAVE|nr:Something about silencing protein 10 [Araneus ventricosus]